MAKLVILITSRLEEVHAVGEAWKSAGAPGVTFLEGYGIRRLQAVKNSGEILPGVISLMDILRDSEQTSMVVLSLIEDATLIPKLQQTTEAVLGDLHTPGSGIFFVVPVDQVVGLRDYDSET